MDIFNESVTQKEKFRIAANKLLNQCFILKKKEETRNDYIFIRQNKAFFIQYFELLGYKLEINEHQEVIGLVNQFGTGRLQLTKYESILLLILRLLYIEKKRELSMNEETVVLMEEIHDKYNMLKIKAKPTLDKAIVKESMKLFKKYNLIKNIENDVTLSDTRIIIYPSITMCIGIEDINECYENTKNKLSNYVVGGEQADEEETE